MKYRNEHPVDKEHRLRTEAAAKERAEREADDAWDLADWEADLLYDRGWYIHRGSMIIGPYPNRKRAERYASDNGGIPVALSHTIVAGLGMLGIYRFVSAENA